MAGRIHFGNAARLPVVGTNIYARHVRFVQMHVAPFEGFTAVVPHFSVQTSIVGGPPGQRLWTWNLKDRLRTPLGRIIAAAALRARWSLDSCVLHARSGYTFADFPGLTTGRIHLPWLLLKS